MIKLLTLVGVLTIIQAAQAESLLIKLASPNSARNTVQTMNARGVWASAVSNEWIEVDSKINATSLNGFLRSTAVLYVQPNYKLNTFESPGLAQLRRQPALLQKMANRAEAVTGAGFRAKKTDNPDIPNVVAATTGADPLFPNQWGMNDIGVANAWKISPGSANITVAVIDTGVDYTHEDLVNNMWRNSGEIPNNGVDDDNNGYVDDVIGWDFLNNDNKPYDLAGSIFEILFSGANPGHGTHCAGNIAAVGGNGKGISGVAPRAHIMALQFIGTGGGTTAAAIKAIRYAVDNGAKVLSNSWGSAGEDPADPDNQALKDAIQYAQDRGVLFIAAAGNGNSLGKGYDNDKSAKASVPASYTYDNIIAVAAIDSADNLGTFSNWGASSVDLAAPGVKVLSTTADGKYSDNMNIFGFKIANWDGTSMATPHVAGAAALYWSAHPEKTWREVKDAILTSVKPVASVQGKVLSNGKLNVENLMNK